MLDINIEIENIENFFGVQDSFIPYLLAGLVKKNNIVYVAKNDVELLAVNNFISNSFPNINIYSIPSWDCLPYDISSPNYNIISERIKTFTNLSFSNETSSNNNLFLTTINGLLIKTAPKDFYLSNFLKINNSNENSFKNINY